MGTRALWRFDETDIAIRPADAIGNVAELNAIAPPPPLTWNVDATSGKGLPLGASEWANLLAVAGDPTGGPFLQWDCSVPSGSVTDLIGAFPGTATIGVGDYANVVAGWSAKGFLLLSASVRSVTNADAALPNIASESLLLLGYISFPAGAPASTRSLITMGPGFGSQVAANLTPTPRLQGLADPNQVNGASSMVSVVRPIVAQINRTAGTVFVCSDAEKLTPALTATPTGKKIWIGGDNVSTWASAGQVQLMLVGFRGAAAEKSQATIKSILTTLNWAVAWS